MKKLRNQIENRIANEMRDGVSLEEASFNARQWAKRMRARERLKERRNEGESKESDTVNGEDVSGRIDDGRGLEASGQEGGSVSKSGGKIKKVSDI